MNGKTHPSVVWTELLEDRGALNGCGLASPMLQLSEGKQSNIQQHKKTNMEIHLDKKRGSEKENIYSQKNTTKPNHKVVLKRDLEKVKLFHNRIVPTLLSIITIRVWQRCKSDSKDRKGEDRSLKQECRSFSRSNYCTALSTRGSSQSNESI